ncbi:hypothetical protein BJ741DRAFT_710107 [Chytriomyces cf. hyalinus JEL632]|nr:hypothetical protein BJ741DRAFT_710107 [Chytriomyces cf. hyalinus JEL632]
MHPQLRCTGRSGIGSSKRTRPGVHFAQSDKPISKIQMKRNASSASSRPNSADNSGQISRHASPRSSKASIALANTQYFGGTTGASGHYESAANGSSRLKSYQSSINLNQRSHHSQKYYTSQIHLGMESKHHQQPEQFMKRYESVPRKAKILPPEPNNSQILHREHAEDIFQVVDDSASSRSTVARVLQHIQKPSLARETSFKREDYFFEPTLHVFDLCWSRVSAITSKPYFGGNKLGRPIHWPCIVRRVLKEYSRLSSTLTAEQSPVDDIVFRVLRGNTLWVNERDDASVQIELLSLDDACDILVEGQMLEAYQQLKALGVSQSRLNVIGLQEKAAMMATQVPKMPFREATGDNLLINLKDKSWFGVLCGAEMIHCGDIVRVKTESCVVTDVFTAKKGARVEDLMLDSSICGYGCGGWVLPVGEMLMEVVRVEFREGDAQSLKLFGYLCYLDRVATGGDGAAKFQVKRGWFLKHEGPADETNRAGQANSCVQYISVPCVGWEAEGSGTGEHFTSRWNLFDS